MPKVRILIPSKVKENLLKKNLGVCCVCKERGVGVEFHHIDENPSNNVESNIAVLCTKEHDLHHRPQKYNLIKHNELSADKILELKNEWEEFVKEAQKPNPKFIAVLNVYGTIEIVHSFRFIIQSVAGKIIFERLSHLTDGPMDELTDMIFEELVWLGNNIKLTIFEKPQLIEYCPCCKKSLAEVLDESIATCITASDWRKEATAAIYINPTVRRVTMVVFYHEKSLYTAVIHKCGENYLHFMSKNYEERFLLTRTSSVRTQVTQIIAKLCLVWDLDLNRVFIGTGDENMPKIMNDLNLPKFWEQK